MWWALLACSSSGLDQPDPVATADTAPEPVADCPWVGAWTLSEVKCGPFAYPTFWDVYTGASMTVSQSATTGCDVAATLTSAACAQTEAWVFGAPLGTEVDVTREGVTRCDPVSCSHGVEACTVGGNVAAAQSLKIDDFSGSLTAVGLFPETGPLCPPENGLVTIWTQAR